VRIRRSKHLFEALEAKFLAESDDSSLDPLVLHVQARGYLTQSELLAVCRWKSPRALPLVRRNLPAEVQEATGWALHTKPERLRTGSLLILQGVSWPMASVVLHFFHSDPYPVLDFRAAWSLGMTAPSGYSFAFWRVYVRSCRQLSRSLALPMRTIDRALWQYSREHA
jgi:hypothetical protein